MVTPSIQVSEIEGVTYGDYGPPRTWIDWWFKKGDTMICFCLQSKSFPFTEPSEAEIAEHRTIIESIRYCRDFPSELPPRPELRYRFYSSPAASKPALLSERPALAVAGQDELKKVYH